MPDFAIFADTQAEPRSVYRHLDRLEAMLPFPVIRVTRGSLEADSLVIRRSKKSGKTYMKGLIPAFVRSANGKLAGLLGRKCTADYKVEVIVRELRHRVGAHVVRQWQAAARKAEKRGDQPPEPLVTMWIGISRDEAIRMKPSQKPWIQHRWPLIEAGIDRRSCQLWLVGNDYPVPPKSSCKFCPFHDVEEWMRLRDAEPEEFAAAVAYERQMQAAAAASEALEGMPYLHRSLIPLADIDFDQLLKEQRPQMDLFGNECEGLCGV